MNKKNLLVVILAMLLVAMISVGGTIAWLATDTEPVVNTFTPSDINITLTETLPNNKTAEMVPGNTIDKNPKVTVQADSEACWLFVKIEENGGNVTVGEKTYTFDDFVTYAIAAGWTELLSETTSSSSVYYREVDAIAAGGTAVEYGILVNDEVTVKETVTLAMMDALREDSSKNPTLTFTAYAVQKANIDNVANAWKQASESAYQNNVNITDGYTK